MQSIVKVLEHPENLYIAILDVTPVIVAPERVVPVLGSTMYSEKFNGYLIILPYFFTFPEVKQELLNTVVLHELVHVVGYGERDASDMEVIAEDFCSKSFISISGIEEGIEEETLEEAHNKYIKPILDKHPPDRIERFITVIASDEHVIELVEAGRVKVKMVMPIKLLKLIYGKTGG